MAKEEIDIQAERQKIYAKREQKLEQEKADREQVEERDSPVKDAMGNSPSVRATDGGLPGTKEKNPIVMAEQSDIETDEDQLTENSTISEIKAELDARGIDYNGVTKKADLFALLG